MKKLLMVCMAVLVLSGCGVEEKTQDRPIDKDRPIDIVWKYLTPQERGMLVSYYNSGYNGTGYKPIYPIITGLRNVESPANAKAPFCDVVRMLDSAENGEWDSVKAGHSVLKQWERLSGESLLVSCGVDQQPLVTSVKPLLEDVVTLDKVELLSPAKVRELRTTASDCLGAKIELLSLTKGGRYLTVNDYEVVTKLILDCENLQLIAELNNLK